MTLIDLQTTDIGTTSALAAALRHTLELTWDRPVDQWAPYADPAAAAVDAPLDLDDLLAEAS
jgi:hypothetical protein